MYSVIHVRMCAFFLLHVCNQLFRQALNRGGPLGGSDLVLVQHAIITLVIGGASPWAGIPIIAGLCLFRIIPVLSCS